MAKPRSVPEIFLYHSFPRHHAKDNARHDLGIGTLKFILELGLLVVAEEHVFPAVGPLPAFPWAQRRICFTAMPSSDVRGHAKMFGKFSLEFKTDVARQFGAQPAFYLTGSRPGLELFNDAGDMLARHLVEAREVLFKLKELTRTTDKKLQRLSAEARRVVAHVFPTNHPLETLRYTIDTLLNLYYPTDRPTTRARRPTPPLHFIRQREWKIFPNLSVDGTWPYPDLTAAESKALVAFNPKFFKAKILGKPRVQLCNKFPVVGGRRMIDEVNRIIVPDKVLSRVKKMVKEAVVKGQLKAEIPVIPLSSFPKVTFTAPIVACR